MLATWCLVLTSSLDTADVPASREKLTTWWDQTPSKDLKQTDRTYQPSVTPGTIVGGHYWPVKIARCQQPTLYQVRFDPSLFFYHQWYPATTINIPHRIFANASLFICIDSDLLRATPHNKNQYFHLNRYALHKAGEPGRTVLCSC